MSASEFASGFGIVELFKTLLVLALFALFAHRLSKERAAVSDLLDRLNGRLANFETRLDSQIRSLGEKLDEFDLKLNKLGQQVDATQETAELALHSSAQSPVNGGNQNWESLRTKWRDARDGLERIIDKIDHKGTRRRYSNIERYSYEPIIRALLNDRRISLETASDLSKMNAKFLSLKRKSSVTNDELNEFGFWFDKVDRDLPKKPKDDTDDIGSQ